VYKKPLVIGINGPPKIGKGWLAAQIAPLIPYQTITMSFATPLREEIMADYGVPSTAKAYAAFKDSILPDGETGRDKLIAHGLKMREVDPVYWARRLTENPMFQYESIPVIIIDDLGFFNEQEWMLEHSERFMTIVMSPTYYSPSMIYEGDSRVCLPPIGGFRCTNSDLALKIFKERLANAEPHESANQKNLWLDAIMERPVGQS